MYEQFYGLEKSPFALTPDPRFLYMTEAHQNARAGLLYAILSRKGFTVLTGDAGTGKTTVLRSVINSLPGNGVSFSFLINPTLSPDEFCEAAAADFGLPRGLGKVHRLSKLEEFLLRAHAEGTVSVLFVDEAQRLSVETLEQIRLLTNFETDSEKLLQIVLVGQDELDEMLDRRELRQLKQRVGVRLHIGPLSEQAVGSYIAHRWKVVSPAEPPFTNEAISSLSRLSAGIPRVINSICDNALLIAYAEGSRVVTKEHINEASRDLRLAAAEIKRPLMKVIKSDVLQGADDDLHVPRPVSRTLDAHLPSEPGNYTLRSAWWPRFRKAMKSMSQQAL
jgi:general secretion pathway protein A